MAFVRRFFYSILLMLNAVVGMGYLACAYSPHVSPVSHPYGACLGLAFPIFALLNGLFLLLWLVAKWKYAAVPLAIFLMGWGGLRDYAPVNFHKSPRGADTIKVLTYNIEGFGKRNADDARAILSYLQESGADVVCLQEFCPQGKMSRKETDKFSSVFPYHKIVYTPEWDGLACYSRYPILSASLIDCASRFNGSALFQLEVGRDTLTLINCHLESNRLTSQDKGVYREILTSPREEVVKEGGRHLLRKLAQAVSVRAVQADSVAAVVARNQGRALVVCGDFNDSPVSYALRTIGRGLTDAYVAAGFGPGFSYNRNKFFFRIDHLLVSDHFKVLKCEVDRSIKASDHYPLWCVLERQ